MIDIKRSDWTCEPTPQGGNVIVMKCPDCGEQIRMPNHKVQDNGYMWPSTCCPRLECRFHGFIALLGWDPDANK